MTAGQGRAVLEVPQLLTASPQARGTVAPMSSDSCAPASRQSVEVAAGVFMDVEVRSTLLGDLPRMPPFVDVLGCCELSWWGLGAVAAANRLGLTTQVPAWLLLVADADPQLHARYLSKVTVRQAPWRAGLGWLEVSLLELLCDYTRVAEVPLERGLVRVADLLAGHGLDRVGLAAAAAHEPGATTMRTEELLSIMDGG